ncbi:MAG: DNA-3-methyladenine glycosylase I [Proteobacteria bacterium]|nr:DNA-3-methyladenine glycosylase I [Pseudomonadota bacterium]MDA1021790.1 DNA-3-methyladenine glycosylase I [Pseudomonadota bacterium]
MDSFAAVRNRAEKRKGGPAGLKKLLPPIKSPQALRKIPDDRWLSQMTKLIFQAGFNWKVIENKWPGFEEVFFGFDPGRLSMLPDEAMDGFLKDARIVRNGQKIATVRHNATFICDLAQEHGSAGKFFADWPGDDFIGLLDVLQKRGSRLGGSTSAYFLRFMGKDSFVLGGDVARALIAARVVEKNPTSKTDKARVQDAFNQWREESGWPLAHISKTLACSVE